MMAFADDGSAPLGEGTMWYTIHVDGTSAYAGISTNITSDFSIDGTAYYYDVYGNAHMTSLYGGADQTTDYGVSVNRNSTEMYYAEATFRASSNDGGYNAAFLNCTD